MSKDKMSNFQKITLVISIITLFLTVVGLATWQLSTYEFTEDDTIPIPTHTPFTTTTPGGETPTTTTPIYNEPNIISNSVELNIGEQKTGFEISVTYPENVLSMNIIVDTSDDESISMDLNELATGKYGTDIARINFNLVTDETILTIDVTMRYLDKNDDIKTKTEVGGSFSFTDIPVFYPPEVIRESFWYDTPNEGTIDWGITTTYHESITEIICYFMIDDDIFNIGGSDYTYEVLHVEEGNYESSIDRSIFPYDVDVFLYLKVNYDNWTNDDLFFLVEELAEFQNPSGTTPIFGIGPILAVIATIVALTSLSVYNKRKGEME